jgi:amidase
MEAEFDPAATAAARIEAELTAVAEREPVVRAWAARPSDDEIRAAFAAAPDGPLSGFSLGVKDVIDTVTLPTERGSPIYRGRAAGFDAACVALARAAGAVVVGKTVTTEFAVLTPAVTTNPHDPTRTPGGSSSGSAAAVAAGMVRVAFGTQTAGSVVRPASFCGVVGFKPSRHLVPVTGVHPLAPSLDTVGTFARTVADVAAVHHALTGAAEDRPTRRVRVARYRSHQWTAAGPATVAALDRAADALRRSGAEVVELDPVPGLRGLDAHAGTIMLWEAARGFAPERARAPELLSDGLAKLFRAGDRIGTDEYVAARRAAERGRAAFDEAMGGFDAWLTPAVVGEAPLLASTGDPVFCRVWTLLGGPACTVPAGTGPDGLPVGVQLVGARWADPRLLAVAARLEAALAASA